MSCGKDTLVAQRRALMRKRALEEEAEKGQQRREEVVSAVGLDLEAERVRIMGSADSRLAALTSCYFRPLTSFLRVYLSIYRPLSRGTDMPS
jgi:hypothetical protein